jgi:hypothetical protein
MKQPDSNFRREARMLATAKKAVWESCDWLSAADIVSQGASDPRAYDFLPSEWERAGRIFSIRYHGSNYYPAYGLARNTSVRPHPTMAKVIQILQGKRNGWGMAFWFASVNSYLGGKRPQDMLEAEQALVVAAENEVAGVNHG